MSRPRQILSCGVLSLKFNALDGGKNNTKSPSIRKTSHIPQRGRPRSAEAMYGLAFIPPPRISLFSSATAYTTAKVRVPLALKHDAGGETEAVPDSVDPHLTLLCTESESSPILNLENLPTFKAQDDSFRVHAETAEPVKRGQSQNSILVVETPDRPAKSRKQSKTDAAASKASSYESISGIDADKSRVVLEDSSDGEEEDGVATTDTPVTHPDVVKDAVCRFNFFSKSAAAQSVKRSNEPTSIGRIDSNVSNLDICLAPAATPDLHPAVVSHNGMLSLPEMNVRDATQLSVEESSARLDAAGVGMHSILPPPTLYFSLSNVTPLSNILANPAHYMEARPGSGHGPGGITRNVNLLVVVKQVADVSRVRARFPVDQARPKTLHPSTRKSAFSSPRHDGRTERVELVVLEGRMRPDAPAHTNETVEKHMFRIVLWGNLARQWTTESEADYTAPGNVSAQDSDVSANRSESFRYQASSREPTALRAGDVIYVENLGLSVPTPASDASSTYSSLSSNKRPRLGAGFPPRAHAIPPASMPLVANGSELKSTSIELCFRSDAHYDRRDQARNFDPDIAHFDPKSRRVLELSRLWSSSHM